MNDKDLFLTDSVPRYLEIEMPDGTLTAGDIEEESMTLDESLCSEDTLRFGCCESSIFKLRILGTVISLANKKIHPYILQGENSKFSVGEYTVRSDVPTADRRYRDIIAYDAMYDIINRDVAGWYNTIFPGDSTRIKFKEFRDSFFAFLGIDQENVSLPQDDIYIRKTVDPMEISGKYIITAVCELNGCFGHIGSDGIFHYVFLEEMTEQGGFTELDKSVCIDAQYEDFTVNRINQLRIRQDDSGDEFVYGDGDNCYIIEGNMLLYGYSESELKVIAGNLFPHISRVWYRPANVEAKGNPCLPVGTGIKLETQYATVYTYILRRTLKGIQSMHDNYLAEGTEYCGQDLNSMDKQIIRLKGMINQVDNSAFHFNTVQNGSGVDIGDGQRRRIIRSTIITNANAQIKVETEILLEVTPSESGGTAVGTISYVMDSEELSRHPVETWTSGKHVFALQNFMNVRESGFHVFDIFLEMSRGLAHIDRLGVLEIFTGTGLVEKPGWNGQFDITEDAAGFQIRDLSRIIDSRSSALLTVRSPTGIIRTDTPEDVPIHEPAVETAVDSLVFGKEFLSELTWDEAKDIIWNTAVEEYIWGRVTDYEEYHMVQP